MQFFDYTVSLICDFHDSSVTPPTILRKAFEEVQALNVGDKPSNIRSDYIMRLVGQKSKKFYPDELRLVKAPDLNTGEIITFVTTTHNQKIKLRIPNTTSSYQTAMRQNQTTGFCS